MLGGGLFVVVLNGERSQWQACAAAQLLCWWTDGLLHGEGGSCAALEAAFGDEATSAAISRSRR